MHLDVESIMQIYIHNMCIIYIICVYNIRDGPIINCIYNSVSHESKHGTKYNV